MIVRISIISLFLVGSFLVSMEYVLDERPDHTEIELSGVTTSNTYITSLQHWRELARENSSLDGYTVSPKAVAEYKQEYEIKRKLPVSPEAITVWERHQESRQYAQELLRIHAYLHFGEETRDNVELNDLKNFFIRKAYERSNTNGQTLVIKQELHSTANKWVIGLCVVAVLLGIAFVLEGVYLPQSQCHHSY